MGLDAWSLAPIPDVAPFHFAVGSTDVSHGGTHGPVTLRHPGVGPRRITVKGLRPGAAFVATSGCKSAEVNGVTTADGVAHWNATDASCGVALTLG